MWMWWDRNFASVRAMYEDRFTLWGFDESGSLVRRSLPARRGGELARLKGLRYTVSLALELMDVAWPVLQAVASKLQTAISWLLVAIIGHGLGLVFAGVRNSMVRGSGAEGSASEVSPEGATPRQDQPASAGRGNKPPSRKQQQDSWGAFGSGAFAV